MHPTTSKTCSMREMSKSCSSNWSLFTGTNFILLGEEDFLRIFTVLNVSKTTAYISPYCISLIEHLCRAMISPLDMVGSMELPVMLHHRSARGQMLATMFNAGIVV